MTTPSDVATVFTIIVAAVLWARMQNHRKET